MCVCNIHPKNGDASHLVIRNGGDILGRSWEHPSRDDVAWGGKPHERVRKNYAVIKK